jgi:uncharacterized protein (DUF983 family)
MKLNYDKDGIILNCPVCGSDKLRPDTDFPDSMRECKSCYSEFTIDGEITLDATKLK